jgi:hypothetical protein
MLVVVSSTASPARVQHALNSAAVAAHLSVSTTTALRVATVAAVLLLLWESSVTMAVARAGASAGS